MMRRSLELPAHRNRRALRVGSLALLAACSLIAAPRPAQGQGVELPVPPFVLLLLDTSAAMSINPSTNFAPVCGQHPPGKSRWTMVQEALAGDLPEDYACEGLPSTYPSPTSFGDGGLLAGVDNSVRFAAATLDVLPSPNVGLEGDFSWGPAPLPALNLGVRSPLAPAGGLYSFYNVVPPLSTVEHNADLQRRVVAEVPWPPILPSGDQVSLAAMLEDAAYFFETHPSVASGAEDDGHDPQALCRPHAVFLITAGSSQPEYDDLFQAEGEPAVSPYGGADEQAERLRVRHGVPTHVFYFNGGPALTRERMNRLAVAGGTAEAVEVRSAAQLRAAMSAALSGMMEGLHSATRTATTFQTHDAAVSQIQVAAGYTVPAEGRWSGHLQFSRFRCGEERPHDAHDFGAILDGEDPDFRAQASRRLITPLGGTLGPVAFSMDEAEGLTPAALVLPPAEAEDLVDFLRERPNDTYPLREHRLGPIVHGSPQLVGPPLMELPFPSYGGVLENKESFKLRHRARPTIAYVPADDGMLHAFVVAAPEALAATVGTELFAYIPRGAQRSLAAAAAPAGRSPILDATPLVRDLRLQADFVDPRNEQWVTALVGGAGAGGRYYYALNVADPVDLANRPDGESDGVPYFLWEMDAQNPRAAGAVRQRLGNTYGRAALGSVVVLDGAQRYELAAAFLSGGREVPGLNRTGRVFFVVSMKPGDAFGRPEILRAFIPGEDGVDDMPWAITGTPAAYAAIPGQPTTRIFVGDAGGRLWRIDTSSTDPAEWTMRVFYDPYTGLDDSLRQPVYFEPSLSLRATGQLVVAYATGDPDNLKDRAGNVEHRVVSLSEELSQDLNGQLTADYGDRPNFVIRLQAGEVPTAAPLVFDSTLFFATYRHALGQACDFGEARIWGVDYVGNDPESVDDVLPLFPTNQQSDRIDPGAGGWAETQPPSCVEDEGAAGAFSRTALYCLMPTGSTVMGFEVGYDTACSDAFEDVVDGGEAPGAAAPAAGSGKPVLTVQTGQFVPVGLLGVPVQGASTLPSLRRRLNSTRVSVLPLMWGMVYDE